MKWLGRLMASDAPAATLLIRALVGVVFASEGAQKFLFAAELGVGRFAKLGLPHPELLAPFVGGVEITCGIALLLGLLTRLSALPLLAVMAIALVKTKLPLLATKGAWGLAHEARTDFCMILGLFFLLLVGAGPLSLDARLAGKHRA